MTADYDALYRHLGLDRECSLDAFRQACRRRISELHPDRLAAGGTSAHDAPIAIDALIAMYVEGVRFHRRHGRLPGGAATSRTVLQRGAATAQRPAYAGTRTGGAGIPLVPTETGERQRIGLALVIGLLVLGILVAVTVQDDDAVVDTRSNMAAGGADEATHTETTEPAADVAAARTDDDDSSTVMSDATPADAGIMPVASMPADRAASPALLALGMDTITVRAIQGEPIHASDGLWEYGPSWLRFERRRLVDWHSSPLRPLAVSSTDPPAHESR